MAISTMILVAVLGFAIVRYGRTNESQMVGSVAVLPFTGPASDPNTEFLKDGITEGITDTLSQLPNLKVMSSSSVFRYKARDSDPQKTGKDLGVDAVLTGRLVQRGDSISISAELVNVADASQIWGRQYSEKLADVAALQQEIARDVSEKLRLRLSRVEKQRLEKRPTENAEAYQSYLRGRHGLDQADDPSIKQAAEFFQQAINKDPNYAAAYAGLAVTYGLILPPKEGFPKARAAAERALALDDNLAEAHSSMAAVHWFNWEFEAGEREVQRALELNPNFVPAHVNHAAMVCYLRRRCEEALQEAKHAQELDPLSMFAMLVTGDILYYGRKYDEAIAQYQKAVEVDPNNPQGHRSLFYAFEYKGDYDHAMKEREQDLTLSGFPQIAAEERQIYAKSGYKAVLRKRIERYSDPANKDWYWPYSAAYWYAILGEKDKTFFWLEKAYEERIGLNFLQVEPVLDNLRSDPRFADLVRRIGFPQ